MNLNYLLLFSTFAIYSVSYSQNNLPEDILKKCVGSAVDFTNHENKILNSQLQPQSLVYDCNTVFWTVRNGGDIQQWDLVSNTVTGGTVVVTNSLLSLAFCGENNALTFYSTSYTPMGITKYDPNLLVWTTIPTPVYLHNNGGYHEDQYFFNYEGSITNLYHFNGSSLNLVDTITYPNMFLPGDTAVDSSGRSWVFTGQDDLIANTLRVYNSSGLINSYTCNFNSQGGYGCFFINNQLYIGFSNSTDSDPNFRNSIVPIIINGSTATPGLPIPFPYNSYTDMASCNGQDLATPQNTAGNKLSIYPNPVNDILNIDLEGNIQSISVYSFQGKLIETCHDIKTIDFSKFQNGTYIIKILSENNIYYKKIIKI